MSTAVIDYGAGNIRSVENAMKALGQKTCLTSSASDILAADHVILPGRSLWRCHDLHSQEGTGGGHPYRL